MVLLLPALLLGLNFFIAWRNAKTVGAYWSEAKAEGGSFRVYTVAGYVMSIAGFTMVYGYMLLMLAPVILPLFDAFKDVPMDDVKELASDLLYLLVAMAAVPSGFLIWYRSVVNFWNNKTLSNGLNAGWNTYAQIRNTINLARHAPGAIARIAESLFGGKGKKKKDGAAVAAVLMLIIFAVLGGYFTASAILHKADADYDAYQVLEGRAAARA